MANQDARYFLNGMKFETEGNLLRTAATDGHRLVVCTIELGSRSANSSGYSCHVKGIELNRLLESSDELARLVKLVQIIFVST